MSIYNDKEVVADAGNKALYFSVYLIVNGYRGLIVCFYSLLYAKLLKQVEVSKQAESTLMKQLGQQYEDGKSGYDTFRR